MTEKIRYDENHIYYETYNHGIMIKRTVCPIRFAMQIVEEETKSPFRALGQSVMFRTLNSKAFLNGSDK